MMFRKAAKPGRISIICPVFNGDRFLAMAIDSVLSQNYRDLELIVIDDGSEDDSQSIALSYANVTLLTQVHAGVSAARNKGLAESSGSYIGFIDSDDLYVPERLSQQAEFLDLNPDVYLIDAYQRAFLDGIDEAPAWVPAECFAAEGVHFHALGTLLSRRETFLKAGIFDETLRFAEDTDWLLRVRDSGCRTHVDQRVVLKRRIHDQNTSYQSGNQFKTLCSLLHQSIQRRKQ